MKKKQLKKDYPELYKWIYGEDKPAEPFYKKLKLKIFYTPFIESINTILNTIHYNYIVKKAKRMYKKTTIHRHVVPNSKTSCGIITGADLTAYNKRALKKGMKRFKYNKLKIEAYFSTDTLVLKKNIEKLVLVPVLGDY